MEEDHSLYISIKNAAGGDELLHLSLLGPGAGPGEGGLVAEAYQASGADLQRRFVAVEAGLPAVVHQGGVARLLPDPGIICPRVPGDSRLNQEDQ